MDQTITRTHWITLAALTLIAFGLRLAFINRPIYTDEAYTYLYFIRDGLLDVLTDYREPNNHVFQTILAWGAVALGGNHPAVMRIPAFIAGVALIPAVFYATTRLYNPRAGLYAAALTVANVPLAEYAVSTRGYSFIALFFALQVMLAADLKTASSRWRWVAYGLLAAFGLYTVPIMLYPLGAVSLWLLVSIWAENTGGTRWTLTRDMMMTLGAAAVLTLLLYTPIIAYNGLDALTNNVFVQPLTPQEFRATVTGFPADFTALMGQGVPDVFVYGLVGLALVSLVMHRRLSSDRVPLLVPTVIWLAALVVIQYVLPPLRTWIFVAVLALMLAGAGLDGVVTMLNPTPKSPSRRQGGDLPNRLTPPLSFGGWGVRYHLLALMLAIVTAASVIYTGAMNETLTYEREPDAQAAAQFLAERWTENSRILLTNGAIHNYEYYLDAAGLPFDAVALNVPREVALSPEVTLYVLTNPGDPYVNDRLREAAGVDLSADNARLEPLATMPENDVTVNVLVVGDD